ncbi:hypothetical protein CYMTET_34141, partial [Cymbomonas tetramitiformis]
MPTPADHLILWTSSVAKGKLQALLKLTSVSSKMRSSSWEKQRGQILAWTQAGLADLQLLPEVVRPHTDALLTSGLFPVDASGAIAAGLWPMEPGVWAERKDVEFNKFREVTAVKALLALVAPSPAGGAAGPIGASGSGGGVSAGTAVATGIPGIGTSAGVAPAAVAAVSPDVIAAAIATVLVTDLTTLARVAEFQRFVKSKVPTFLLTDVLPSSFLKKRKHVHFEEDEEEARAAGGGRNLLPPLDAARRERLATLGSGLKTVNDKQLARALCGDLAPEDVVRPTRADALPTAMPSRGALVGVNLLVAPVQRLQQVDEGRIKWKDGDLTVAPKTKKCKNMDEWERGFFKGLLAFCSHVVLEDLAVLELVVRNGKRVVLERRLVDAR